MVAKLQRVGLNGAIRLPRSTRTRFRLRPGSRVIVEPDDCGIRIRPAEDTARPRRRRRVPSHPGIRLAEDISDLKVVRRRRRDPNRELVPWEQVKAELGQ